MSSKPNRVTKSTKNNPQSHLKNIASAFEGAAEQRGNQINLTPILPARKRASPAENETKSADQQSRGKAQHVNPFTSNVSRAQPLSTSSTRSSSSSVNSLVQTFPWYEHSQDGSTISSFPTRKTISLRYWMGVQQGTWANEAEIWKLPSGEKMIYSPNVIRLSLQPIGQEPSSLDSQYYLVMKSIDEFYHPNPNDTDIWSRPYSDHTSYLVEVKTDTGSGSAQLNANSIMTVKRIAPGSAFVTIGEMKQMQRGPNYADAMTGSVGAVTISDGDEPWTPESCKLNVQPAGESIWCWKVDRTGMFETADGVLWAEDKSSGIWGRELFDPSMAARSNQVYHFEEWK